MSLFVPRRENSRGLASAATIEFDESTRLRYRTDTSMNPTLTDDQIAATLYRTDRAHTPLPHPDAALLSRAGRASAEAFEG